MNGASSIDSEFWSVSSDGRGRVQRYQSSMTTHDELDERISMENFLTIPESDHVARHRERSPSRSSHRQHHHRKHRSLSSPRTTESGGNKAAAVTAKPKKAKRYLGTTSTSLTSIPNAIKLSMLNSGLLSLGEQT